MSEDPKAPQHVYPLKDLREHATDGSPCWCEPREDVADDGITPVILHNSADGRERYETGEKKPS